MLLLLFLLVSLDKNPELARSLKGFLGFYKENRELISSLLRETPASSAPPAPAAPASAAAPSSPVSAAAAGGAEKKDPTKTVGSVDLLEEYLKRCSV